MIKVILIRNNESIEITSLVDKITWSGECTQAARSIEFTLISSAYDKNLPKVNIELGNFIAFYLNDKELFRGYIFFRDKAYNSNTFSFTAYDCAIYTLKNEAAYNFRNVTPESVTNRVCSDFGIPIGSLISTGISLSKKFISVNLYEIIMSSYTIASQNNGIKYMILAKEGKLNVIEKGEAVLSIQFENGVNLLDSSYSESLEKMVNVVKIVDKDGNNIKEITDEGLLNTYGKFQKVIVQSKDKDETKRANSMLNGIDSKIRITGYGDTSCITGMGVKVYDSYTGLTGWFYIDSDKHTWKDGMYTVDLVLNLKNIMDESERGDDYE